LKYFFIALFCSFHWSVFAQQDSAPKRKWQLLPVPAFGYAPETKSYIGAVVLSTFRIDTSFKTRTSNAKLKFTYTQRRQRILELGYTIFTKNEKWLLTGQGNLSRFPDNYWGLGNNSPDSALYVYNSNRIEGQFAFLKNLKSQWFAGPSITYASYSNFDSISGQARTITNNAPVRTFGPGITLVHDSRDNILTPQAGWYLKTATRFMQSKNYYQNWALDVRGYKLINKKHSLVAAGRYILEKTGKATPYYDLVLLGGDNRQRGYYYGRYRSYSGMILQGELRYTVYRRWGVAAFGTAGKLFDPLVGATVQPIYISKGVGLRFQVDRKENVNMRFDFAFGKAKGFYVAFGEAF
jgi:outer membrane protein assembly factor BamA